MIAGQATPPRSDGGTVRKTTQRAQRYFDRTRRFVRDYTDGLNVRDFKRLFDRDAAEAYKVLARDQGEEPAGHELQRFGHRVKVVFLGISTKLSPVRRILFAAALASTLIGVIKPNLIEVRTIGLFLTVGTGALWFLLAIAILIALLVFELVDRVRVRDELEVARQLQADLLPQRSPDLPGYRFAHSYRTANEVGGDYYDFQRMADGRLAILIGDASGHGIAAGLLMAIANATLKTALDVDPRPERVAGLLNGTLYRTGDRRAFMTLFYGLLEPDSGRLVYVCAGHPFPFLRRTGGAVEELGEGSLPLGMRARVELPTGEATLAPGDQLVLFSDGLPEAIDSHQQAFGFERLRALLATPTTAAALHDRILMAFDGHVRDEPLTDDFTLVVVARDSEGEAPPPRASE